MVKLNLVEFEGLISIPYTLIKFEYLFLKSFVNSLTIHSKHIFYIIFKLTSLILIIIILS